MKGGVAVKRGETDPPAQRGASDTDMVQGRRPRRSQASCEIQPLRMKLPALTGVQAMAPIREGHGRSGKWSARGTCWPQRRARHSWCGSGRGEDCCRNRSRSEVIWMSRRRWPMMCVSRIRSGRCMLQQTAPVFGHSRLLGAAEAGRFPGTTGVGHPPAVVEGTCGGSPVGEWQGAQKEPV